MLFTIDELTCVEGSRERMLNLLSQVDCVAKIASAYLEPLIVKERLPNGMKLKDFVTETAEIAAALCRPKSELKSGEELCAEINKMPGTDHMYDVQWLSLGSIQRKCQEEGYVQEFIAQHLLGFDLSYKIYDELEPSLKRYAKSDDPRIINSPYDCVFEKNILSQCFIGAALKEMVNIDPVGAFIKAEEAMHEEMIFQAEAHFINLCAIYAAAARGNLTSIPPTILPKGVSYFYCHGDPTQAYGRKYVKNSKEMEYLGVSFLGAKIRVAKMKSLVYDQSLPKIAKERLAHLPMQRFRTEKLF